MGEQQWSGLSTSLVGPAVAAECSQTSQDSLEYGNFPQKYFLHHSGIFSSFSNVTQQSCPAAVSRKNSWRSGVSDEKHYVVVGWTFELCDGRFKSYVTYRKDKKTVKMYHYK